jgi:hypothetical protein
MSKAVPKGVAEEFRRSYLSQAFVNPSASAMSGRWRYYQVPKVYWSTFRYFHPHPSAEIVGFDSVNQPVSEGDPQSQPRKTSEAGLEDEREFDVNSAIWLALTDVAKSIRDQRLWGWIAGFLIAAITWALGGFDLLIESGIALAATNSLLLICGDIKRSRFSATRTMSDILQFPEYLALIAVGRFIDLGLEAHAMRFLIAAILVIPICAWKSFRELVFLLDLTRLDELVDDIIDAVSRFINRNRGRV